MQVNLALNYAKMPSSLAKDNSNPRAILSSILVVQYLNFVMNWSSNQVISQKEHTTFCSSMGKSEKISMECGHMQSYNCEKALL